MKITPLILLALVLSTSIVFADSIELNNGKTIDGKFIGRDGDAVKFEVDGMSMTFQAKDVKNISMGSSAAAPSPAKKAAPTQATSGPASIAAGSKMTIKLTGALDTGRHSTGHKFTAVLEGALSSNGTIVAPAGSKVYGVVSEAVKARRVAGNAKLILTLTDINIGGNMTPIKTSGINAITQSTGKSSAGKVGRAAAIGALADGSSGARTGAKIGLGAAVLSGGNQVVIPTGTLLDFQLTAALEKK